MTEIAPLRRESHAQLGVPAEWIPEPSDPSEHEAAVAKLQSYFETMGFEPLGRAAYRILSTARPSPTGGELLRPEPDDRT